MPKIAIIGAGIAGLCAGVYARKCGYEVDIFEQHSAPGGLATSWTRGDYTFETALQWLLGSKPGGLLHEQWREVFDIDALRFVYLDEYARVEDEHGDAVTLYTHVDTLEKALLARAPQDAAAIHHFTSAVRRFAHVEIPQPHEEWMSALTRSVRSIPYAPALLEWSKMSLGQYGERYNDRLLRAYFSSETKELAAVLVPMMFAWLNEGNAGYPIGGSRAITGAIASEFERLGGRLHCNASVEKILVRNHHAVGVQVEPDDERYADWVISAADGHATIYDLLDGGYTDPEIDAMYSESRDTFPSYVQVSLGVAKDLSDQAPIVIHTLDQPYELDPMTRVSQIVFRTFWYDPTFAPPEKTAVTAFLPTRDYAYWQGLETHDWQRYQAEKTRIADKVISVFEARLPGIRSAIEIVDVSTPASVIRFTRNWKGSMEGWLPTPSTGFSSSRSTLPELERFLMIGQWASPGGGLPTGLITARAALRDICKTDRVHFLGDSYSTSSSSL